ncbi:unnamed protein product [Symbiodinium natans]|uniref:CCHC-type domain-containing protein n=1 Tax=Symbiodinium natans TaxID=878477 RepID=A0A812U969_9DINO|nr:unnamed protein product [Symbiodinium natans]
MMLRIRMLSGEEVTSIPLEEVGSVKEVKQRLHQLHGLPPRFRQKLLLQGACLGDADELHSTFELDLVLQSFCDASQTQVSDLVAACEDGSVDKARQHYTVRLGSVRQVRELAKIGINGKLRLQGRLLRAYPLRGDESVAGAEPAAPAAPPKRPQKRDRDDAEGDDGGQGRPTKVIRRGTHDKRKACFLCGEPSHELPDCPIQRECVLVCREWGGSSAPAQQELQAALAEQGFEAVRSYWHGGVCYVRLRSNEEAAAALQIWGGQNRLQLGEEAFQVRAARSTRRREAPEKKAPEAEAIGQDEECALCGSAEHVFRACPLRNRAVRISCASLAKDAAAALEQVKAAAAELETAWASEARWHRNSLFVIMASDKDAKTLLHSAAAEGLEIDGSMASVERATAKATGPSTTRTPGLRPEVRKRKPD